MNKYSIGAVILALIAGGLIARAVPSDPARQKVIWNYPGGSLEMEVEKDLRNPETMLSKVFEKEFSRAGAMDWLGKNYQVFSIEKVAPQIEKLCPDKPNEPLEERQRRLELCIKDHPVLAQLRSLSEHHKAPFQYIGEVIRVGIPEQENERPTDGHANACRLGGFLGKKIEVTDLASKRSITVEVTGYYDCTGYSNFPDLQLNPKDAKSLFGRALQKYQTAMAVEL